MAFTDILCRFTVSFESLLNCVPYVLTCQRVLRVYMIICSRLACSRASVPYVLCMPTCSRAITTNDKEKFSIICFLAFL